jgi:hypothetical protein
VQKTLLEIREVAAHNAEDARAVRKISEDLLDRSSELTVLMGGERRAKSDWRSRKKNGAHTGITNGRG